MRDAAINLRARPERRDLIDQAARLLGKNRSDFMLEAARDKAQSVLLDRVFFNLDSEKFRQFTKLLDAPPARNAGLERLIAIKSKNIACLSQPIAERKTTPDRFEIGAAVCPSGDLLVFIRSPEDKEYYRWISFKTVSSDTGRLRASLFGEAHAAQVSPPMLAQAGPRLVCQRSIGDGQVLRRVQVGSACFDECIDTATGRLLRRVPASCDASCAG